MATPGFGAELSLYKHRRHYHTVANPSATTDNRAVFPQMMKICVQDAEDDCIFHCGYLDFRRKQSIPLPDEDWCEDTAEV